MPGPRQSSISVRSFALGSVATIILHFLITFVMSRGQRSVPTVCPPCLDEVGPPSEPVVCLPPALTLVSKRSAAASEIDYDVVPCVGTFGFGPRTDGFFPTYEVAGKAKGVPLLKTGRKTRSTVPKLKKVVIIGKGGTTISAVKTDDVLIATVNHALAWQNHSDIHFQSDYYFHQVEVDFFCRAQILVMPTYFHVQGRYHVHASVLLDRLRFAGPIFLTELPDGPSDPRIQTWTGSDAIHSSGDLAFAWLLRQGYREFESFGIGGSDYGRFFVSSKYVHPKAFVQNQKRHTAHIMKRIRAHNATWVQH